MGYEFLQSLSSPNKEIRQRGEAYLQQIAQNPASFCSTLFLGIEQSDAIALEIVLEIESEYPSAPNAFINLQEIYASHQMAFVILRSSINGRTSINAELEKREEELDDFFYELEEEQQEFLKYYLLNYLSRKLPNTYLPALKSCACIVGELAGHLFGSSDSLEDALSTWPSLLSTLSSLAAPDSPHESRQASMYAFSNGIMEHLAYHFTMAIDPMSGAGRLQAEVMEGCRLIAMSGLQDTKLSVRTDAMKATMLLLEFLHQEETLAPFASLPIAMTKTFVTCISDTHQISPPGLNPELLTFALESVEVMIELVSCNLTIMKPCLPDLAKVAVQATHTPGSLDPDSDLDAIRRLCMELALTIIEVSPTLCRKLTLPSEYPPPSPPTVSFVELMIFSCFQMMKERIDFESDEEWIKAEFKEQDPDHIDHCKLGTSSLVRCFDNLGMNSSWTIATQVLERCLKSEHLLEQDAAISAMGAMSYYMDDIESHQKLFHLVLPYIGGGSPRTCFKAISFLASSSDVLTYDLNSRRIIIPALLNQTTKQTQPSARIRAHALEAVGQFLENQLKPEETGEWADAALGRFTTACTEGPLIVMENAITAIGSFAASSPASSFNKYYSVIMPILKNLLNSTSAAVSADSSYKPSDFFVLRSKALETISILFTATDVNLIAADMTDIMTTTTHFDLDSLDASDPFKTFVIKMWMRISKVTGPAFVPYLPHIMPEIIKSLEVSVTCEVPSYYNDEGEEEEGGEEGENENWMNNNLSTIVKEDGSKILVQTTQIEEQSAALHATLFLTSNLQHHIYPYARRICLALDKLITNSSEYLHASESLEYVIITLTELTRAVKRHETFDAEARTAEATKQTIGVLLRVICKNVGDDNLEVQECCFQVKSYEERSDELGMR
ncbi:hypothetical protein TL16_g03209 [Triparma laevis f. inornata]|uniref:Uncharacterized protein n=1 Tax=Triparma laevis f. inornata TaxID=1714386 RepID=A0A9W7A1H1_9STRA|nr:hypothetical protein TL16_g03209 [Triparma laevis f. inornata]